MVSSSVDQNLRSQVWSKPPGSVLFHRRRSFSESDTALLADLISLQWSVEAMVSLKIDKIFFSVLTSFRTGG
ncbi:hypothetical protein DY000_02033892 [Brassica cretica]|uniref:Uncharacterized protein n=1 Tax=Brassica cretica TaxID=69181 RepID=A0ABQ7DLR4_BRACR|nr:hypothetical protein DY000_02033892 [Brassica cretica]